MNKETYAKLLGKKDASFEEMDRFFGVSTIHEEDASLREIAKKLNDKIVFWIDEIEKWIHPDAASFGNLEETEGMDEARKNELVVIYKKLFYHYRTYNSLELDFRDEKAATFITAFFSEWKQIAPKIMKILEEVKDKWRREGSDDETAEYFG